MCLWAMWHIKSHTCKYGKDSENSFTVTESVGGIRAGWRETPKTQFRNVFLTKYNSFALCDHLKVRSIGIEFHPYGLKSPANDFLSDYFCRSTTLL